MRNSNINRVLNSRIVDSFTSEPTTTKFIYSNTIKVGQTAIIVRGYTSDKNVVQVSNEDAVLLRQLAKA